MRVFFVLWLLLCLARLAAASPVDPTLLREKERARDAKREPLARAIVDAYPNWNGFFSTLIANWSPDGKRILFGSQRDGAPEIYAADPSQPASPALVITRGPERAVWARYTADGKSLLYLRDQGGDENHHIWRADLDGSHPVDLTPEGAAGPIRRDEPFCPRGKPDRIVYSAGTTKSPDAMVFVQSLSGGAPLKVFTNHGPGWLSDVTSDGARALFFDYRSQSDAILFELDLGTQKTRRIYPPEGKTASLFSASYSADDRRILVATDEGKESSILLSLDLDKKELARYVNPAPATAPLSALVSPAGDRVVVAIDAGNHGEVRILDAKTLQLQRNVEVPLGDVMVGSFRPDGKMFSILIQLPDQPGDVYGVDVATGKTQPLRNDARPGLAQLAPISAKIEIVKAFDGLDLPINVYLPRARKALPAIVIFHGGPSSSSAVRWNIYARFFASLGYAVLEPNVRGSTGFGRAFEMADNREKRADWLKDLESVNAWVKKQPWCDPARVVVWGQSYGGYTTLMALTRQPKLWRAGVDLYGVADLKAFLLTTDASIRAGFVSEFGDLDKDGPLLDAYSPMRDKDKIVASLFVYSGQNDPRVPRSESDAIVAALRARKIPVEYMVAPAEGHSVDRRETKIELLTRTARFLEDALR